mmetsp:Transcript_4764/g.5499  ORF Transcript_4764/g.5499 Transcript_4764/m.5499 type:complete len:89 (-) Transcript_4764:433-699(-)
MSVYAIRESNLSINGGHVLAQVDQPVGVSPLVIIPGNNLVESLRQVDACLGINNGTPLVVNKVLRNDWEIGVSKNSEQLGVWVGGSLL